MKRIFITGCARSGTTLLNRLFYAFEDTKVIDYEISIDDFCDYKCRTKILVGKRTPRTILSVPLTQDEIRCQLDIIHTNNLIIVNIIRDGRDVVHQNSTGPTVNVNRWIGCMLHAQEFLEEISVQVRYEELVNNPDFIQKKIEETLGLISHSKFSEYPNFIPDSVFDEPEYRDYIYYNKRKISRSSVGHSDSEYIALCDDKNERNLFERTLEKYGYLDKDEIKVWPKDILKKEMLEHKEQSRKFCQKIENI